MKTLLFAGLLGTFCGASLLIGADQGPPAAAKPLTAVLDSVTQAGYSSITEVSYDNGQWEVEALKDAQPVGLRIDPQSGKILRTHPDEPHPAIPAGTKPMKEIVIQLQNAGFDSFKSVEFEHGSWELDAHNTQGWRELIVHAQGKVLVDWPDE